MPEEIKKEGDNGKVEPGAVPPENKNIIALAVIYHTDTKTVEVSGPVGDKGLCYMMLECGRDAVKDYHDKQLAQAAMKKPGGILNFARGLKN